MLVLLVMDILVNITDMTAKQNRCGHVIVGKSTACVVVIVSISEAVYSLFASCDAPAIYAVCCISEALLLGECFVCHKYTHVCFIGEGVKCQLCRIYDPVQDDLLVTERDWIVETTINPRHCVDTQTVMTSL